MPDFTGHSGAIYTNRRYNCVDSLIILGKDFDIQTLMSDQWKIIIIIFMCSPL